MRKISSILAFSLLMLSILGNGSLNSPSFSEEVLVEKRSEEWLRRQALLYLNALPQESGSLAKKPLEEADRLTVRRSFLVRQNKGVLSHVIADVEYAATVQVSEGRYLYQFSNFKVFEHGRNRYGRYERVSSRGKSMDKVGKSLKPLVAKSLQEHMESYTGGLKAALR